jgi:hypothetical protein
VVADSVRTLAACPTSPRENARRIIVPPVRALTDEAIDAFTG